MSFRDCLSRAVAGGEMDPRRAQEMLDAYDGAFQQFQQQAGVTQSHILAAQHVVSQARIAAAQRRRVMQLQAAATQRNLAQMAKHRNARGNLDPGQYLLDRIHRVTGAGFATLSGKYEAVKRGFRRDLTRLIADHRTNLAGMRKGKDTLNNMAREAYGENTGDAHAAALAASWLGTAERARQRFNAAGGHIGRRADWGMPQRHDTDAVRRASYDTWRAAILYRNGRDASEGFKLDLDGMGEHYNGGLPFTEQSIEPLLHDAFQKIRSSGYSARSPSVNYGSALYNQRADHRFFKFSTADDWIAYDKDFGSGGDVFRTMLGHLDGMAMDIALMEELGPNPNHAFRHLADAAKHQAARSQDGPALRIAEAKVDFAGAKFDLLTGRTNVPRWQGIAKGASAVRQYLTSTHLGAAVMSSVTDFNTQRVASSFAGFGQLAPFRNLGRVIFSRRMKEAANDAGLIFENAVNHGNAVARYELEDMHIEGAARLADFTIRSSGLGWLTEMQRHAAGLTVMNGVAGYHGRAFDELPRGMQQFLSAYGISRQDWGIINQARVHQEPNGLRLLRASEIEELGDQGLADRYMEAIVGNTEMAVPTADLTGRAMTLGTTRPGTLIGEAARFAMQFKAFPVTIIVTQIGRIVSEMMAGRPGRAMNYAAGLFVGNTILGMAALQMKEMAKGRNPRDMTDPKVWMAAMAQGGGLGIFGDFLFSDQNRFGGSIGETLAGPTAGAADDLLRFTVGNLQEFATGEDTNIGREFTGLLRRYTPGGSLWYLRLAYEREVLDQLQSWIDPEARKSFRARVRRAKSQGTGYFAKPGDHLSDMSIPDFEGAFGQ